MFVPHIIRVPGASTPSDVCAWLKVGASEVRSPGVPTSFSRVMGAPEASTKSLRRRAGDGCSDEEEPMSPRYIALVPGVIASDLRHVLVSLAPT